MRRTRDCIQIARDYESTPEVLGTRKAALETVSVPRQTAHGINQYVGLLPDLATRARSLGRTISRLFCVSLLLNWTITFFLCSRVGKPSESTLLAASVLVLGGRWLDIRLLVAPLVFDCYPGITALDIVLFVGFGAAFSPTVDRALESRLQTRRMMRAS